jgi:crossover junction endodeoxyribonuclease RuvC
MRILGIDPALKTTGYGIIDWDGRSFELVASGVVNTRYGQPLPQRLDTIHRGISGLIEAQHPDIMILEKVFIHYHHPTTAFLLGQARGIICLACAQGGIPLVEYAATHVKKAVVGRGQASKTQVQRMVATILNLKVLPKYEDTTDALALAIAYTYFIRANRIKLLAKGRS